jgi:hypothetical protein
MSRRIGLRVCGLIIFSSVVGFGQHGFDECKIKTKAFDFESESFDNTSGSPSGAYYSAFFGRRVYRTLKCSDLADTIHLEVTTKGTEYFPKSKPDFFVESTSYYYPILPPSSSSDYFSENQVDAVDSISCRVDRNRTPDSPINGGVICSRSNLDPFVYYGTQRKELSNGWAFHFGSRSGPPSYYIDSILTFKDYGVAGSRHFGGHLRSFFGDSVYTVFQYSLVSVDSRIIASDTIDRRWYESRASTPLRRPFRPFPGIYPTKTIRYDVSGRIRKSKTVRYPREK